MTFRDRLATPSGRGLLLFLLTLVVYLLTRTRDFGGDGTVYALAVDRWLGGQGASRELWHPHHPLFNIMVAGLAWFLRAVGLHMLTLDVGAAVSAVFAAATVGGLAALLSTTALPRIAVWGVCLTTMAAGGLWDIGTTMEVYTVGAAAVLAWLAAASRHTPRGLLVGLALAGCILGHLVLGLLVIPTILLLRRRPAELARAVGVGLGGSGLAVAVIYTLAHGARTPLALLRTMAGSGLGSYLVTPSPFKALTALHRLVAWSWFDSINLLTPAAATTLHLLGAAVAIVLGTLALVGAVASWRGGPPLGRVAALGVAALAPLWLVWDVGNVEHVVAATSLLATLVAFGAARLADAVARPILAAVAATLLAVNGLGSAVPHARPELSRSLIIATFVARSVPPDVTVAGLGRDGGLRLSLPYLSGRHVADLTMLVASARAAGRGAGDGLDAWRRELAAAGPAVLLPDVTDPGAAVWVAGLGLPDAAWRETIAALRPAGTITLPANGVAVTEPFTLTRVVVSSPGRPGVERGGTQ